VFTRGAVRARRDRAPVKTSSQRIQPRAPTRAQHRRLLARRPRTDRRRPHRRRHRRRTTRTDGHPSVTLARGRVRRRSRPVRNPALECARPVSPCHESRPLADPLSDLNFHLSRPPRVMIRRADPCRSSSHRRARARSFDPRRALSRAWSSVRSPVRSFAFAREA